MCMVNNWYTAVCDTCRAGDRTATQANQEEGYLVYHISMLETQVEWQHDGGFFTLHPVRPVSRRRPSQELALSSTRQTPTADTPTLAPSCHWHPNARAAYARSG